MKCIKGGDDFVTSVTPDTAGNVIVAGYYEGTIDLDYGNAKYLVSSNGQYDMYLAKYDSSGNFLWAKTMGSSLQDYAYAVQTDSYGNIYLTGTCSRHADFDGSNDTAFIHPNGPSNDGIIF
ncbi:MAG: hypothetical protein ABUL44_05070, partial [Flavobacterium sp.]